MGARYFSDKIVKWYLENRRPLPWRDTTDPYRIWLSEVILQQTRVAQGLPYYQRFTDTFPTVHDLAGASEQQVLRLWQGLGYYTRARNLHKCAKTIVASYDGRFPSGSSELIKLPGIGHYTAAAIASFAFGEKVAVVDGNVYRILSRIFGIDTPINTPNGQKRFTQLANELISDSRPGLHNQAVMEFGATFCTPRNPRCPECPFRRSCQALALDLVDVLPVKTPGRKTRNRYFYYLVIERNGALLMKKRDAKDIWHGLFDFLLIEKNRPVDAQKLIAEVRPRLTNLAGVSGKYVHTLTHQIIHGRFICLKAKSGFRAPDSRFSFYTPKEIADLPKPVLISRFLADEGVLSSRKIGSFESV